MRLAKQRVPYVSGSEMWMCALAAIKKKFFADFLC